MPFPGTRYYGTTSAKYSSVQYQSISYMELYELVLDKPQLCDIEFLEKNQFLG